MTRSVAVSGIPPAGVLGRVGRFFVGAIQVWYSVLAIRYFGALTRPSLEPGIWILALIAFALFSADIDLGFSRRLRLGRKPLYGALAAVALAGAFDAVAVGTPWGPTAASVILAVTVFTHLHMGTSHLLAAVTGIRGCEMRAIPYLIARARRGGAAAELQVCPGLWTPIDRWEARLRGHRA